MKRLALALVVLLAGCEGGWHPLDCALGNSYSSDWCPSGTLGYRTSRLGGACVSILPPLAFSYSRNSVSNSCNNRT